MMFFAVSDTQTVNMTIFPASFNVGRLPFSMFALKSFKFIKNAGIWHMTKNCMFHRCDTSAIIY